MNRMQKHKLERSLVELENLVQEFANYCSGKIFDSMFSEPLKILDGLSNLPRIYRCQKPRG